MGRAGRVWALIRKELIQFLRARAMLLLILYLYTAEVLMCTYAMSFDVRNLATVFLDNDRSVASRQLQQDFSHSEYFRITHSAGTEDELASLLDRGAVLAAVIIPPGFAQHLVLGEPAQVQLLLDGATANTASVAHGYAQRIVQNFALEKGGHAGMEPPVVHRPRVWYNSELDYRHFMVLSMMSLAGMLVGVITAAAGIVREKEAGTIEQLLVTPASAAELILAKMVPPLLVGLMALFPSLAVAAAVGVPLRGSLLLFLLSSALFLSSSMGIGIMVATVTQTLQQALLVSFLVLFPVLFLSGTIVPLESMPLALQYLSEASPLRHYMEVVLGLFLKGVGIEVLWPRLLAMFAIGVLLLGLSLRRLRRHLV
ncbi:MAG: ABC transporter permease [Gammaproteobacteria bacterium]|nr:ABC transporter permease [Gammaproteobacteria bacterium]